MSTIRYRFMPLLLLTACRGDTPSSPPEELMPASVDVAGGDGQSGTVATQLSHPLRVRVATIDGQGVPGVRVAWSATAGTLIPGSETTDGTGHATATWILGTQAIAHQATARVDGVGDATFDASAMPDVPATVTIPEPAALRVGGFARLTAAVQDRHGNAIPDAAVEWSSTAPLVAEVTAPGVVTGRANGEASIVATVEDVSDTVRIVVDGLAWTQLAVGNYHTCGLKVSGEAYCWGQNSSGELGDGTQTDRLVPTAVVGGHRFVSIAAEWVRTCGIATSSEAYCWGNLDYNTGVPPVVTSVPVRVGGEHQYAEIQVGILHECARRATGEVYCWGNNEFLQLGASGPSTTIPQPVQGQFAEMQARGVRACGVEGTGTVSCWGSNIFGQVGNGEYADHVTQPTLAAGGITFRSFAAGPYHTCGIATTDALYCWGSNYGGQLGNAVSGMTTAVPTVISVGLDLDSVHAGGFETCVLDVSGALWCWGRNEYGQLGNGTTAPGESPEPTPQRVLLNEPIDRVYMNSHRWHECAITRTGDAYCWGFNWKGAVGDGTTTDRHQPVRVIDP